MPALTEDLDGVLESMLGLYGSGQPSEAALQALRRENEKEAMRPQLGSGIAGYGSLQKAHTALLEQHTERDGGVRRAVGDSANGTVTGRGQLSNQIADHHARVQAISTVSDTRFSGPAMLDSAQTTISNAARQVNTDADAAQRQAARIMPPESPSPPRRSAQPRKRHRRRRRSSGARSPRRGTRLPSDRTTGGKAVRAANECLGLPYIWGGGSVGGASGGGFDCSGLTQYAVASATDGEVVLPRTTYEQIYAGQRVHPADVQPGDLVFPADSFSSRGPEHVQLAAGEGRVIEAPYSGSTVKWSQMSSNAVVVRVT